MLKLSKASKATLDGCDSVFVSESNLYYTHICVLIIIQAWFSEIIKQEEVYPSYRASAALEILTVSVNFCTGSSIIGGPHLQISKTPKRSRFLQLSVEDHQKFQGSLTAYFAHFTSLDRQPTPGYTSQHLDDGKILSKVRVTCWRTKEGNRLCKGDREELQNLVVSLPFILLFEIADESLTCQDKSAPSPVWDLPATLTTGVEASQEPTIESSSYLIYDLLGLALVNKSGNHFIAQFISEGSIYTYDGMQNDGNCVKNSNATMATHLSGKHPILPEGYSVYSAIYAHRGGMFAQDAFFKARRLLLAQNFNIKFSDDSLRSLSTLSYTSENLDLLQPSRQYWLRNPMAATMMEYVSKKNGTKILYVESDAEDDHLHSVPSPEDTLESEEDTGKVVIEINDSPQVDGPILTKYCSPSPTQSLPDSLFSLNCRCGVVGDGNKYYLDNINGEAIQCNKCRDWSHIACQRDGRASSLKKKDPFICDNCDISHMMIRRTNKQR